MKYVRKPKSAVVKDIDIDIADVLGHKYRYGIEMVSISANVILTHL